MFNNGATLFTSLRVPVTPFGLPGHQSVDGDMPAAGISPLFPDDYIILPPGIPRPRRTGSWVVTYGFDQFLFVDPDDPTKGWGIFANISLADQATNPVHWFLNLGAGGTSPLPGRSADSWGAGLITTWRPVASSARPSGPSHRAATSRASSSITTQRSPVGSP